MRRILLTLAKLLAVIAAAFLLCGSARAEGSGEYGDINSALSDAVPPEASEILEGGGITPDNNGAAALSFGGVLEFLRDMLMDRLTEPLRLFASLCGVVILCALSRSSADGAGGNMSGVFSAVGVLAGAGMTTAAISGALRDTLDVLSAASEFMLVFVPVFAGVIAAMGKAAAASAANTVILAAAQFFSQISVNFLTPVCGTVMGLSVTGAVHPEMSTDKLGELIRKAAVWGLSLLMTVFMSVLSAQTFVTNSADNVLIRTAKFAVSSGVPIVGGTISDAVNTVHASLSLMHSSIGTYGIAAGIVTVEEFDSLLISLAHDRNRNFVFPCFCGKGFRVSGKNVARCGDAAFRLIGFIQQLAVRDGSFRQSLGNAAADLINAVNGIAVQFFQHFFKEGSEELYQLGAHLNDFLPRLQCSGADFISHIITSCSDLVL